MTFYPPGLISNLQLFSSSYLPAMHANFSAWLCVKSSMLGPIVLAVFVKKINYLIDWIQFYYQRNHQFKERFDLLLTIVYNTQNYIDHDYICSTPSYHYISSTFAYPKLFEIFLTQSLVNFRKVLPPSYSWGARTMGSLNQCLILLLRYY